MRTWGRLTEYQVDARTLSNRDAVADALLARPGLAQGSGRSYGDVGVAATTWSTRGLDRFIDFDSGKGILKVESGVELGEIQRIFSSRGWMLPVTPGTQYVTVGGAIANDIHGKNHHGAGTFGEHVLSLTLARSDGSQSECSQAANAELFRATIGGLGLTGIITQASIQLKKVSGPWIDSETIPFKNLKEFWTLSRESERFEYSVAWFDCTTKSGRGIFTRGNHSAETRQTKAPKTLNFPLTPPFSLINRLTLKPLNLAYYILGKFTAGSKTVHYRPFFYPLDAITNWNRAYGSGGFFQYQCVIPKRSAKQALDELLGEIRRAKAGSLLAVLKTTGDRNPPGLLTFPTEGVTLALDFPNRGAKTIDLLTRLDEIVLKHGGRVNPSKDATMSPKTFAASFPNYTAFNKYRDPKISSHFAERVFDRKP
ncbi:MAG: hypothetical protein RLZZ108_141 [Actinomycetota bacterium]